MAPTDELQLVMIKNSKPERFQFVRMRNDDDDSIAAYGPMSEGQARAVMCAAGIDASLVNATIRGARERAALGGHVHAESRSHTHHAKSVES